MINPPLVSTMDSWYVHQVWFVEGRFLQAMGLKSGEAEADFNTNSTRDPPEPWLSERRRNILWNGGKKNRDAPLSSLSEEIQGKFSATLAESEKPLCNRVI